jgi:hypothetical protein
MKRLLLFFCFFPERGFFVKSASATWPVGRWFSINPGENILRLADYAFEFPVIRDACYE